jgi:hypothetical protein
MVSNPKNRKAITGIEDATVIPPTKSFHGGGQPHY